MIPVRATWPRALFAAAAILVGTLIGAPAASAADLTVLPRDATWKFDDSGRDFAEAWRAPSFDDSAWKSGKAPLGFGDDYSETDPGLPVGTVVGFGPKADDKIMTTYFRTSVEVPDLGTAATVTVYVHVDDGAVVYVNGVEAFRRGIDAGVAVAYATSAKFKPKEETFTIPASTLKKGKNVIAVEVHQDDGGSSDLWFELGLTVAGATAATGPATPSIVIPDPKAPLGGVTKVTAVPQSDAKTSFGFCWYTSTASGASDLQVARRAGAVPDFSKPTAFVGTWSPSTVSAGEVVHKATATGLAPATAYWYRVGDASLNLWSEPAAFRTAPTTGAFTFIDLADTQAKTIDEALLSSRTLAAAVATVANAGFLVVNGDLVDVGMNERQWDWLLGASASTLRVMPLVPAAGNHEEDKGSFRDHFALPSAPGSATDSGVYYSFTWSNTHVIVLNTNEDSPEYADLSPAQVAWFTADAAAARTAGAQWLVLVLHKGPYTTSNHATDADIMGSNGVRTKFASLIDDAGVDLVLQGHDHIYARSLPIKDGAAVTGRSRVDTLNGKKVEVFTDPRAPIYVIPATAGPKTYFRNKKIDQGYYKLFSVADEHHAAKYGPDPADASRPLRGVVQNFMSVTIDGKKLTAVVYEIDQKIDAGKPFIVDQFSILKN